VKALTERIELEITAVDNASGVIAAASDKISGTLRAASVSYKDLAVGVSGAATAGFSLYMAYDSVEKAGVQVDRAQLMVKSSVNAAEKAQTAYNDEVSKYGANSAEAKQKQLI
jgi:predicted ABC-type ATPase